MIPFMGYIKLIPKVLHNLVKIIKAAVVHDQEQLVMWQGKMYEAEVFAGVLRIVLLGKGGRGKKTGELGGSV